MNFNFTIRLLLIYGLHSLYTCDNNIYDDDENLCRSHFQATYLTHLTNEHNNSTWSTFSRFNAFSELDCKCKNKSLSCYNITEYVIFIPETRCLLDSNGFSFETLFGFTQANSIAQMQLVNIKGIDLQLKSFYMPLKNVLRNSYLEIYSSSLDFYSNGVRITDKECNAFTYNLTSDNQRVNFFNSFLKLAFINVIYPPNMCPFVFSNSKIRKLAFDDITNSLLRKNRLMFNDYFLKECNSLPVRII